MSMKALIFSVIGLLVLGSISGAVYYVDERERAIKLRFGALIESNIQPGLKFKLPFVDVIRFFDARVLTSDAVAETYYTCLLYTSPSPRDRTRSRMPSSA